MIQISTEIPSANGMAKGLVEARNGDILIHSDRFDLTSAVSRRRFAKEVARKLNTPGCEDEVDGLMLHRLEELRVIPKVEGKNFLATMPKAVRDEALDYLKNPDLLKLIRRDIQRIGIAGDASIGLGVYITGTSRLLPRPIAAIVRLRR